VGQVTSAAWGAAVGSGVGLALVGDREAGETSAEWVRTGEWEIDVAGDRSALTVGLRPPLDPSGRRLHPGPPDVLNGTLSDH
jgi:4-methylaminobutanoate oxidase (formaldehyde-forming)